MFLCNTDMGGLLFVPKKRKCELAVHIIDNSNPP